MKRRNTGDITIYPALFITDGVVPISVDDKGWNGDGISVACSTVELFIFINSVW